MKIINSPNFVRSFVRSIDNRFYYDKLSKNETLTTTKTVSYFYLDFRLSFLLFLLLLFYLSFLDKKQCFFLILFYLFFQSFNQCIMLFMFYLSFISFRANLVELIRGSAKVRGLIGFSF